MISSECRENSGRTLGEVLSYGYSALKSNRPLYASIGVGVLLYGYGLVDSILLDRFAWDQVNTVLPAPATEEVSQAKNEKLRFKENLDKLINEGEFLEAQSLIAASSSVADQIRRVNYFDSIPQKRDELYYQFYHADQYSVGVFSIDRPARDLSSMALGMLIPIGVFAGQTIRRLRRYS